MVDVDGLDGSCCVVNVCMNGMHCKKEKLVFTGKRWQLWLPENSCKLYNNFAYCASINGKVNREILNKKTI